MTVHGEKEIRGQRRVPQSPVHEGRFGRMFRRLSPAPDYTEAELNGLAEMMRERVPPPSGGWAAEPAVQPGGDNEAIPAAFTYLGQFLDHDITFDPNSSLQQVNDPDALVDFRSPRFDLDSVYGSGPVDEPFQYVKGSGPSTLLLEANANGEMDLPRTSQGIAIIGDPRNDENTIVSQLQVVFCKLHNKIAALVAADDSVPPEAKFARAQQVVRWHYQRMIVDDYLPRLVGAELMSRLVHVTGDGSIEFNLRYYLPRNNPYMPIEFSAAAFRFGHSQVRGVYDLNDVVTGRPIFLPGEVGDLEDLRGNRPLPGQWTVDWRHFVNIEDASPQPSRLIDTHLADGLFTLPGHDKSLPLLNLLRGQSMELPSGQDVAQFMREVPLSPDELGDGVLNPTPLWFYLLKEAEVRHGGTQLGPVGGRIVAEVLLGMLKLDRTSWVNVEPTWTPTIVDAVPGDDGRPRVTLRALISEATS